MKKILLPLLVLIFAAGFLVRLYRFNSPVADWHSFRQGDTNAVSSIFVERGINLLEPKYYDISNIQSGKDNPEGYRLVEFPIYNAVQALLFGNLNIFALEQWGRLISIFSTLTGALLVFLLTKKYADEVSGIFAAIFYLFLPFSIYFGRTILPDPSMTASILAGTYFFDSWLSKKKFSIFNFQFSIAVVLTALAFLLKPHALFFTLPMIYLAYKKFGLQFIKKWELWLFAVISLIPLIWWRYWINFHPEGIPVSSWLLNGDGIRFRPAFFRWIFYERITKLIMGYLGIVFLIAGFLRLKNQNNYLFFFSFIVSSLLYLFIVATGNVRHDYYQIIIIPTISMVSGLGVGFLFEKFKKNVLLRMAVLSSVILIFLIGWAGINKNGVGGGVRDFFNINDEKMVEAGIVADRILPKDAVVIAPYDGSTTFLNIIKRQGYPSFQKGIEEMIEMGANYLVIAIPTKNDYEGFGKKYEKVASGENYLILKLK